MSRRRPPRAWVGTPLPADPSELLGPRGLTRELLDEEPEEAEPVSPATGGAAFYWSLLSDERKSRIESVVASRLGSVAVVLDRLLDAHNTAAILRTAEGLGLGGIHVVPNEESDAVAHRRVTQDAHKWLEISQHQTGAQAAAALKAQGFEVWAGHLDAKAILYSELPADRPVALLFGNEHEGPQAETLAACTGTFRIPMAGFTQSFNVSVAAGIALSQQAQRRRAFLKAAGDLSPAQSAALRDRFTLLAAKLSRRLKR
ncbi:MAG TPA: RNA methyltransferase [Myxococcales bacterium]|nr:RNA methyltransferase [Myxococcales bacterium]